MKTHLVAGNRNIHSLAVCLGIARASGAGILSSFLLALGGVLAEVVAGAWGIFFLRKISALQAGKLDTKKMI